MPDTSRDTVRSTDSYGPLIVLLALSVVINYIDRSNLAIAAPLLRTEIGLSASQLGLLLSAFFWTYATFQLLAGWMADRYRAVIILAAGFALWSLTTALTAAVNGLAALFLVRFLLGVGESVAFPCYSKILAQYLPETRRCVANAAIAAGVAYGPALGMLGGGLLVARLGWRPFFVTLGLGGLLWLIPWFVWMPRGPGRIETTTATASPPFRALLFRAPVWGSCVSLFAANYFSYTMLTWLPSFLVTERHLSLDSMAAVGASYYVAVGTTTLVCGWIADRWVTAGASVTRVRRTFTIGGLTALGTAMFTAALGPSSAVLPALFLAGCSFGVHMSNHWAVTQTLAGPAAAGRWTGLQNFIGNLAGVVAPALAGFLVDRTGHFSWTWAIAGLVAFSGAAGWQLLVPEVRELDWRAAVDERRLSRVRPA